MYQLEVYYHKKCTNEPQNHEQEWGQGIHQQDYPEQFCKGKTSVFVISPALVKEFLCSIFIHVKIPPNA